MNRARNVQPERGGIVALSLAVLAACNSTETAMDVAKLKGFGTKYTAA